MNRETLEISEKMRLVDLTEKTRHRFLVRTTLSLDDDVAELAARRAKRRGVSPSKTRSDLVRRGLRASAPSQKKGGLVVFQLPPDSPGVTTKKVRKIESEAA